MEGARIRLTFAHAEGGLKSRDGKPLTDFQIAGADGAFVDAKSTIDGATILVESPSNPAPTQARFAWSDAPLAKPGPRRRPPRPRLPHPPMARRRPE